jgi:hypothetical protein
MWSRKLIHTFQSFAYFAKDSASESPGALSDTESLHLRTASGRFTRYRISMNTLNSLSRVATNPSRS